MGETKINLAIRTSRIFKLMNEEWKQVHHHGPIEDPSLLDIYQKAVRGELKELLTNTNLRGLVRKIFLSQSTQRQKANEQEN